MTHTAKATPFHLSRIYAQGWNAARGAWRIGGAPDNPYDVEPERSRWQAGFHNAQADPREITK
jgi:hypothetical protein